MFLAVALRRVLIAHVVSGPLQVASALEAVRERVVSGDAVVAHAAYHVLFASVQV